MPDVLPAITADHIVLARQVFPGGPVPSGSQDQAQAENLAVVCFQYACSLEGLSVPSERLVRLMFVLTGPPASSGR